MTELDTVMRDYTEKVSMADRLVKGLERPTPVNAPGQPETRLPIPLSMTLRFADEGLIPRINEARGKTSWMASDKRDTIFQSAASLLDRLRMSALDEDPLALAEADNLGKLTVQIGGNPGWHVMPQGYVKRTEGPWLDLARALIAAMTAERPYVKGAVRRGTNHGSPSWDKSDLDILGHAALAAASKDWDTYLSNHALIASETGAPFTPSCTILSRSGPLAKAVAVYGKVEGKMCLLGEAQGTACRKRAVLGVPLTTYFLIKPMYEALMGRLLATQFASVTLPIGEITARIVGRLRQGALALNDDISGFDQNVPAEAQDALEQALIEAFPALERSIRAWRETERLDVISPGLKDGQDAWRYTSDGTTHSGVLPTSAIGTCINGMRCMWGALGQGWVSDLKSAARWLVSSREIMLLGDDTQLLLDQSRKMDRDRWRVSSEELGFTAKLLPGAVYLRRCFTVRGGTALASRVLQQTAFNEHPTTDPTLEQLGLWSRTVGIENNVWFQDVWKTLKDTGPDWLREKESIYDLRREVETPEFAARVKEAAETGNNPFLLAREAIDDVRASPAWGKIDYITRALGRPLVRELSPEAHLKLTPQENMDMARAVFNVTVRTRDREPSTKALGKILGPEIVKEYTR